MKPTEKEKDESSILREGLLLFVLNERRTLLRPRHPLEVVQSLRLLRIVPIRQRPCRDQISHVGVVQADVFHVRRVEAHVRVLERQRHVGLVERVGRVARLEREPLQDLEDLDDSVADGRGAHFAGADGEHHADAVGERGGGGGPGDELLLGFVPEDVDGVVGDEGAVEELVRDAAVGDGHGVKEGEGGGGGERGFAERHSVHPLALLLEWPRVVGEDGALARIFVCRDDEAGKTVNERWGGSKYKVVSSLTLCKKQFDRAFSYADLEGRCLESHGTLL